MIEVLLIILVIVSIIDVYNNIKVEKSNKESVDYLLDELNPFIKRMNGNLEYLHEEVKLLKKKISEVDNDD